MVGSLSHHLSLTFSAYTCPTFNCSPHCFYLPEGLLWLMRSTQLTSRGGEAGSAGALRPTPAALSSLGYSWCINSSAPRRWGDSETCLLHWLQVPLRGFRSSYLIAITRSISYPPFLTRDSWDFHNSQRNHLHLNPRLKVYSGIQISIVYLGNSAYKEPISMTGMENVRYTCGQGWAQDLGIEHQMYPSPHSLNWKLMS